MNCLLKQFDFLFIVTSQINTFYSCEPHLAIAYPIFLLQSSPKLVDDLVILVAILVAQILTTRFPAFALVRLPRDLRL
ncbi:hypothetical protein P3T76_010996 [Phytophthora citrophthora]|uniref:Uncharacterized protein n=1 Tax=Phytophthora citrophthora TaxID=4793 RepID=A0AAD9GBB9_9STRA|nr:hypothetical protein P3T76_010996 [Phytophthora citrophthora]